jgi:hypothetical protein
LLHQLTKSEGLISCQGAAGTITTSSGALLDRSVNHLACTRLDPSQELYLCLGQHDGERNQDFVGRKGKVTE